MKALILARDERIQSRVRQALRLRWPECEVTISPLDGDRPTKATNPETDVIFLSVEANEERLKLIGELRASSQALVLAVGPDDESDVVDALEAGADDYVSLPTSESLIVAKVNANLRRMRRFAPPDGASVTCRDLDINPQTHEARVNNRPLYLTPTEFNLLYQLARNEGQVVTRQALETLIWGDSGKLYVDILRKHVQRLRRKLQSVRGGRTTIRTIPRVGYRLGSRS